MKKCSDNDCCSSCYRRDNCVGRDWFCKSCQKPKDKCSFANKNKGSKKKED